MPLPSRTRTCTWVIARASKRLPMTPCTVPSDFQQGHAAFHQRRKGARETGGLELAHQFAQQPRAQTETIPFAFSLRRADIIDRRGNYADYRLRRMIQPYCDRVKLKSITSLVINGRDLFTSLKIAEKRGMTKTNITISDNPAALASIAG